MPRTAARRPRSDGARTREAILRRAVELSTVEGLEGLSIGTLASALGMSKSGVYAHFDSKVDLQLATVAEAGRLFADEVVAPALAAPAGREQVLRFCDGFLEHLRRRALPGGCFFAGAVLEMGARPGPVKDAVAAFQDQLTGLVRSFVVEAAAAGELAADERPEELVLQINGLLLGAHAAFVLKDDPGVLDLTAGVLRRRLAVPER